jgi:hypothetical protein
MKGTISTLIATALGVDRALAGVGTPMGVQEQRVEYNPKMPPPVGSARWDQAMDQEQHGDQVIACLMSLADVG